MTAAITSPRRRTFTLIELLVVIGIMALLISFLLPALNRMREASMKRRINDDQPALIQSVSAPDPDPGAPQRVAHEKLPMAQISRFDTRVNLTPRLSIGTTEHESIYEAAIEGTLVAHRAADAAGECEIQLPLPPKIISLADLSMTIDGNESDALWVEGERLVWRGVLPESPAQVKVKYTAVGRGLYTLQTPPGKIIDAFKLDLSANGSDVRMLDLSLQPTRFTHAPDRTTYVWDYNRLMFGRPISMDVLGIAPIDRLGELSWLGPISVAAFGIVLGLMSRAFHVGNFDRWMLVLVLGTFTGAYPLMYFAQQFIPLHWAMAGSGALVMTVIALRVMSTMGAKLGLLGVALPAAAIMTLALDAAIHPQMQGLLLTALVLGLFILAMMLAPRFREFEVAPALRHA